MLPAGRGNISHNKYCKLNLLLYQLGSPFQSCSDFHRNPLAASLSAPPCRRYLPHSCPRHWLCSLLVYLEFPAQPALHSLLVVWKIWIRSRQLSPAQVKQDWEYKLTEVMLGDDTMKDTTTMSCSEPPGNSAGRPLQCGGVSSPPPPQFHPAARTNHTRLRSAPFSQPLLSSSPGSRVLAGIERRLYLDYKTPILCSVLCHLAVKAVLQSHLILEILILIWGW